MLRKLKVNDIIKPSWKQEWFVSVRARKLPMSGSVVKEHVLEVTKQEK